MKNPQTTKEPKLTEEQESKKRFFERYVWVDGRKRRPDFGDWLTIETGEEMWEFIANEITLAEKRVVERFDRYAAYCGCGDAIERTGLYPDEATYHCFGCDETYQLINKKDNNK